MGKDSPAAPPPPDYTGAAQATAEGNIDAARIGTRANRPNEYTPLGSRIWENVTGGGPDDWQSTIQLSPQGQGLFDQQLRISQNLGDVGEAGLNRVGQAVNQPFDMSGVPDAPGANEAARKAVVDALMARQQPAMDRTRTGRENALMVQGHNRGGEAWNAVQDDLGRSENDARMAAELAGGQEQSRLYGMGTDARSRAIQEQAYLRQLPLSELNALRTGSQPGMPQFGVYGQQQTTTGPNMAGATQAQGLYDQNIFNQQVGQQNATTGAVTSAATMAAMFF